MEQNEAEVKSEEESADREVEIEQKEQTFENSMEQNVAERSCEEEDYILWFVQDWTS